MKEALESFLMLINGVMPTFVSPEELLLIPPTKNEPAYPSFLLLKSRLPHYFNSLLLSLSLDPLSLSGCNFDKPSVAD